MKYLLFFFCLLASTLPMQAAEYGLRVGGMQLTPSGTASLTAAGVQGNVLDIQQDMKLGQDTLPYAEVAVEWGQHAFHLSWLKTALKGSSSNPSLLFNFNGKAFFTPPYTFNVDIRMIDGGFTYYPLFIDRDTWRIRMGAELAVKSLHTKMRVAESNFFQQVSSSAIIPTIGIRADARIKSWLTISTRYSTYRMSGSSFRDAEALLDINPLIWYSDISTVNLFAGYRQLTLKLNGQTNGQLQTDTTLKGPIVGLRASY